MSNYTPIVLYGPKDSLPLNDANKFIKGVQYDAEFAAIATAIASKQDTPLSNLAVGSTANTVGLTVTANTTTSQSFGIKITAGTNSGDRALLINDATSTQILNVRGDRVIEGPAHVDMTPYSGSFTVTFTGGTTAPTGTATYYRIGQLVTLILPAISATSNATTFTLTGVPGIIQPVSFNQFIAVAQDRIQDNGVIGGGANTFSIQVGAGSGIITMVKNGANNNWTASGSKGINGNVVIQYLVS